MNDIISKDNMVTERKMATEEIITKYAQLAQAMAIIPNPAVATSAVGFIAYKMNKEILEIYGKEENKDLLLAISTSLSGGIFFLIKRAIDVLVRKNPPLALITSIFSASMMANLVLKIQGTFLEMTLADGQLLSNNLIAAISKSASSFDFRGSVESSIASVFKTA